MKPNDEEVDGVVKRKRAACYYQVSLALFLLLLCVIAGFFSQIEGCLVFDFAGYAFPCIAGILAGGGIYFGSPNDAEATEKISRVYFCNSVAMLLFGLDAYCIAHASQTYWPVIFVTGALLVPLLGQISIVEWKRLDQQLTKSEKKRAIVLAGLLLAFTLMVIVFSLVHLDPNIFGDKPGQPHLTCLK